MISLSVNQQWKRFWIGLKRTGIDIVVVQAYTRPTPTENGNTKMKNNITMLNHPTMQRKIRNAIWMAKLQAKATGKPTKQWYVQNRHGNNILRVDVAADLSITVWGDMSRNITDMVVASIYANRR